MDETQQECIHLVVGNRCVKCEDDTFPTNKFEFGARETMISPEEHATILAALTFWRQCRLDSAENRPPTIHQIATNGGTLPHVNDTKMQLLIERINGAEVIKVTSHDTRPLGTDCSVCGEPQYATPSGAACANGHGGATPLVPGEIPQNQKAHHTPSDERASARCSTTSGSGLQCRLLTLHPGDKHEWGIVGLEAFDPTHNRWLPV